MTDMITAWSDLPATPAKPGDGGNRKRLPDTRPALTRKVEACGFEVYLNLGFYPGSSVPAELFITIGKEGSDIGCMFDALACQISVSLQYGVPWSKVVEKMRLRRFGANSTDEVPSILHAVIVAADGLAKSYAESNK
jgi:hypothetical protein